MARRRGVAPLYVFSVVFAGIGAFIAGEQYRFEHAALSATARVVEHETLHTTDKYNRPLELPVDILEFETAAGETVRFSDVQSRNDEHRPLAEQVAIFYPPSEPRRARLAGHATPVYLIAWGLALAWFAAARMTVHWARGSAEAVDPVRDSRRRRRNRNKSAARKR